MLFIDLRRLLGLLLVVGVALPAISVRGDGLIRDGVGPISAGRGGTNQAFADNSAIILDNPSGMVNVAGSGLAELGADTVVSQVDYSNPLSGVVSETRPLPMPVLGFIQKSEDERWAWGIGAFAPAGFGASYGTVVSPVLGPSNYHSLGGLAKILPGLSYKVNDRLAIGGTFGLALSYAELMGPFVLQNGPLAGVPAQVDLHGFGAAPTGSVGFQYQVASDFTIGGSYTEQTNFDLRGDASTVLFPGFPVASNFDDKIRLKWPRSTALGFKYDICQHRRFSADVIWYDWGHAFDQIGLQFSNPSNPIIPPLLNSVGASLPIKTSIPTNWSNSVSMRLGYEWLPDDFNIYRCGYTYHSSPVADATLNPYLDGVLEHAFSLGYSRKFARFSFNTAYQYSFGKQRMVGTSDIIGGDFDNSMLRAQAHIAMFSLLFPF